MASIAIIVGSSFYSFGTISHPGPAFLPLWCGIIIAALSLIVFIKAVLKDKIKENSGPGSSVTLYKGV